MASYITHKFSTFLRFLKLLPFKCLTKCPVSRHNVVAGESSTITCGHLKREALTIQVRVALPILPPVSRHGLPPSLRPLDGHRMNITSSTDICHQNQVEVWVTIDGEPDPSFLHTGHSVLSQKQETCVNVCCRSLLWKPQRSLIFLIYLLKETGTIPALYWAICKKAGSARSKCCKGGLHQPPLLLANAKLGGQKFVAVTIMLPGRHHLGSLSHLIS